MRRLVLLVVLALVGGVLIGRHAESRADGGARAGGASAVPAPVAPTGRADTAGLQPGLARAITRAIAAAQRDGVTLRITSGYRTPERQQQLFDEAVRKYGSTQEASHYVLPPDRSKHVRGEAVDVGPRAGAAWLEANGVHFGLCRRYDNEYWHFELLAAAKGSVCPPREAHA